MTRLLLLALTLLASCASRPAPRTGLQSKLEQASAGFHGIVGVHVRHLETGEEANLRADETFPTASLVKVPILIGLFVQFESGKLGYRDKLLTEERHRKREGEDLVSRFEVGAPTHPAELAMLMCSFSDNSASLWCQELAGGGAAINAWLEAARFPATRVNSRVPGREADYKQWGWGQTTPREMAELLVRLRQRRTLSPAADEEMLRLLSRAYWSGEALSALPPELHAFSKQGAINRSRSEVLLVESSNGPYVLCVITKEQQDTSWEHDNEGFVLLRTLSRIVYEHFEGDSRWQRPAGSERFH
ncbi:MAG: serine hydrolase [Planctomycetia bacterium]